MHRLTPVLALLCCIGTASVSHTQAPDSARVLRAARSAQARFESVRRRHLPRAWSSSGGACDERIGRFCLTHGDDGDEDDWEPPPEADATRRARGELLSELDHAAARLPGDGWIAGQRVRYHVEAGQNAEAFVAAAECRASAGWCLALAGFARHAAGEWMEADSLFTDALRALPPEERREWTDLSLLLDEQGWRPYRRASAERRDSLERRFWWLADPLWMEPGNDRRTEHFARHVLDRLQDRARSTEGVGWGSDLRELLLRYGWPTGWERIRETRPMQSPPSLVGHYPPRARSFDPPVRVLADPTTTEPTTTEPDAWTLKPERPRTEYLPPYADRFGLLEHQMARFRRGDSLVIVAAYDLRADSVPLPEGATRAALVVAADEGAVPVQAANPSGGARGALRITVSARPAVLSLEVLVPGDTTRAFRARYGVRPLPAPGAGVGVSDVLLTAADPLPRSLPEAVTSARGSTFVRPGEHIGLYWEVYGLRPTTETIALAIGITRDRGGWLRRIGERIGLAETASPVRLNWRERVGEEPFPGRSLAVTLPDLSPGRYTLDVSVSTEDGATATTSRRLEVKR